MFFSFAGDGRTAAAAASPLGCPLVWFSSFVRASQGVLGCNLPCFNSAILALSLGAFFGGGLTVPSQFVGVLGCILPYFNSAKSALYFCLLGGFGIWLDTNNKNNI